MLKVGDRVDVLHKRGIDAGVVCRILTESDDPNHRVLEVEADASPGMYIGFESAFRLRKEAT